MDVDAKVLLREASDLRHLFADKWTLVIMIALSNGPLRRTQILQTVNSYSVDDQWSEKYRVLHDSILARALKKMIGDGLLVHDYDGSVFPPRAHYSLTPEAVEFLAQIREPAAWASRHADLVARAREHNRAQGASPDVTRDDVDVALPG